MWPRVVSLVAGVWLVVAPVVLGYDEPARAIDRVLGPVAAAAAIVAMSEVVRAVRWLEALVGVALVAAPWAFGYGVAATVNSVVCGVVLAIAGSRAGRRALRFGGGWKALLGATRNF